MSHTATLDTLPPAGAVPRRRRVLCVDDDPILLAGLRHGLAAHAGEWDIEFLQDPRDAVDASRRQAFDLVVADVSMPGMDGISMIEAMREFTPGLRSIVLSGVDQFDVVVDAVNRVGILRYLRKPCSAAELIDAIAAALQPGLASRSVQAVFEQLPQAVLLVDSDSRLLFANRRAAPHLDEAGALGVDPQGLLAARERAHVAALSHAIRAVALGGQDDVLALPRRDGRGPVSLALTAWGDGTVIYVHDAHSPPVLAPGHLSKLLGLTPSEGRLAHALASTGSLEDAARMCGITLATARTYLKLIFAKTGTRGQADLVRRLMGQPRVGPSA